MKAHPDTLRGMLVAAALALLAIPAASQAGPADGVSASGSHFFAVDNEFLVNQATSFVQYQPQVALRPDGQGFVIVWSTAAGADVHARVYDGQGAPLTAQFQVDTTFTSGTQDEPTVAMDETGSFLVAWTDRHGNDGFSMGVFARVFDAGGAPLGPDFQLNVVAQSSQWEPCAAAMPGGGWVVGWTGTDGGATFMRLLAADGTPLSGEIEVAQVNSKQIQPVPAVAGDGTIFFAWIDFNGKAGSGNGTSILGRVFDPAGNALGPEFKVNQTNPGEQREARTAADRLGRFVVVWEDRQADAEGIDIAARRYSKLGVPLSDEWQVNTNAVGDQVLPAVACDWVGNTVVVWQDHATGIGQVKAQRYDPSGVPLGGELEVSPAPGTTQQMPAVAVDWAGESFVFAYAELGNSLDVSARRYRFEPETLVGEATAGGSFGIDLDLPGSEGFYRLVLLALGSSPGLPLPDGRHLALNPDVLFYFVLANPDAGGAFTGCVGPMPAGGIDAAGFTLPANPVLVGLTLHIATITLDLSQTGLSAQLRHVTSTLPVTIQ